MNKLQDIKKDLDNGCFSREHIKWLIKTVEHQKEVIRNLQEKTRFSNYMKIANENLALEEALQRTREQRDFYKQAYNLSKTRS
ncbi:hypothetical protein NST02_17945 [Robertmurraya sp. FSL W8-0741]|uniref:hypothetical protein n=1 Tax=Robertmurraya sp. FSL W8-0741 TaxID=2954629 RepID=UPI0030FA4029